jgi:rhodanese-related sulfurtransferase
MPHPSIEMLDPEEVKDLLDRGKLLLVDVREPAEFAVERIHGALLYPFSTFDAAALPRDWTRRVVFCCGSGKRSLAAAEKRLAAGNDRAAHMGGGMTAWKRAGLPLIALSPATGGPVDRR